MTLHVPVDVGRSSKYSSLNQSDSELSSNDEPTGPRLVPILKKHTSKWNAAMSCKDKPLVIKFDTLGMPEGYGLKHGDLVSYSLSIINTIVVGGSTPAPFQNAGQKIKLRIEWPGYDQVDFSRIIDINNITISQLAGKVASVYTEFYKTVRQLRCTEPTWALNPERFETLRILHILRVGENVYQAQVAVG